MSETSERAEPAGPGRAPGQRSAATIYDIAELAGVNPSTVSRALSRPGRISQKTEERIREAAGRLNYRVNPMARALPTGRTRTLGLIVADITNPMFFDVMRGAERAAAKHGYTLVLAESQESGEREAEAVDRVAPSVDGLILVTTRLTDDQIRARAQDKPLIVVNRRVEGVAGVVPRLEGGIEEALEHLEGLGHRRLAYLAGPERSWMNGARWTALRDRAERRGMSFTELGPFAPTLAGGAEALGPVLGSPATAVVAYNDLMAIGLLRAAQGRSVDIPDRLSLVGFDDIFGSDFTSPPLTTVAMDFDVEGELAVRAALALIDEANDEGPGLTDELSGAEGLSARLIVRGTTGPV